MHLSAVPHRAISLTGRAGSRLKDCKVDHDGSVLFEASLSHPSPPEGWSCALQALWWDAHDDWERAHSLVQMDEADRDCAWVHAYLHRKEVILQCSLLVQASGPANRGRFPLRGTPVDRGYLDPRRLTEGMTAERTPKALLVSV